VGSVRRIAVAPQLLQAGLVVGILRDKLHKGAA
jgi:hypothetical protein